MAAEDSSVDHELVAHRRYRPHEQRDVHQEDYRADRRAEQVVDQGRKARQPARRDMVGRGKHIDRHPVKQAARQKKGQIGQPFPPGALRPPHGASPFHPYRIILPGFLGNVKFRLIMRKSPAGRRGFSPGKPVSSKAARRACRSAPSGAPRRWRCSRGRSRCCPPKSRFRPSRR